MINNDRGLTLVELLAVIVISSILIVTLTNIFVSGINEQTKQSKNNQNIVETSYALKVITKDFRKVQSYNAETNEISVNCTGSGSEKVCDTIKYFLQEDELVRTISRDGNESSRSVIANNVSEFKMEVLVGAVTSVGVTIKSTTGQDVHTELSLRSGN